MAIFLKKNDTSIWNVYLSDSRKKRTIQNNPARFLLFLLDATRHVRFSTIIFRLPIFLFVHEQEDSCTLPLATHKYCQVLFIFFFPRRLRTPSSRKSISAIAPTFLEIRIIGSTNMAIRKYAAIRNKSNAANI